MKPFIRIFFIALGLGLALVMPRGVFGSGGSYDMQVSAPVDPDLVQANKAIKEKNWDQAVDLLARVQARDDKNAETFNLLGYSERNRGNLEAAFKHYERALALNPKHRGAHEYLGEAYLMTGNIAKAEEQLAVLNKLCLFSCEEYRDLKTAIAGYKRNAAK